MGSIQEKMKETIKNKKDEVESKKRIAENKTEELASNSKIQIKSIEGGEEYLKE